MKKLLIASLVVAPTLSLAQIPEGRAMASWDVGTKRIDLVYVQPIHTFREVPFFRTLEFNGFGGFGTNEGSLTGGFALGWVGKFSSDANLFVGPQVQFRSGEVARFGIMFGVHFNSK